MKDFCPAPFLQILVFCPFKPRPFPPPRLFQPQIFFSPSFARAEGCVRISGDGAFSSPRYKENKKFAQSTLILGAQASLKCQKRLRKMNASFPRVGSKTSFKGLGPRPFLLPDLAQPGSKMLLSTASRGSLFAFRPEREKVAPVHGLCRVRISGDGAFPSPRYKENKKFRNFFKKNL